MAKPLIVTPLMEFQWAKVFEPEDSMEAGKPRAWSIDGILHMNDGATLDFVTMLETQFQTLNGAGARADKNGWPWKEETDASGAATGRLVFRFRRNETSQRGKTLPPPVIVDAKRQPWPADQLIGNGSKGKIAFDPYGWDSPTGRGAKGMSLWLNMVQVIEFVPYVVATAEDVFAEEEGYSAPTAAETPFQDEAPARPMSLSERMAAQKAGASRLPLDEIDQEIPF